MGICTTLSATVLYDPESRFIFHYLRARVGGNIELRCKFPHVPGLEPLTEMGIATFIYSWGATASLSLVLSPALEDKMRFQQQTGKTFGKRKPL